MSQIIFCISVLALVQFLGFFPFSGVLQQKVDFVNFKWLSFRVFYSVAWLISGLFFIYFEIIRVANFEKLNAKNLGWVLSRMRLPLPQIEIRQNFKLIFIFIDGLIFYLSGIGSAILFIQLGQRWPKLIRSAIKTEAILNTEAYSGVPGNSFTKNIKRSSLVLLLFALSEHLMSWASFLYDRLTQSRLCKWEIGSYFYFITSLHLEHIYKELPVNMWTVMWAEYINFTLTFIWTFNDIFIIIVSYYIASLFRKINHRLEFFEGRVSCTKMFCKLIFSKNFQIVNNSFWEEIRCDYTKVCELQEKFDKKIGNIVCLACLIDLYFICLQLLNVST